MDNTWINQYCLAKKSATTDFKVEWQWTRYMVADKMFVAVCNHKDCRPIITVKCDPMFNQLMREQYKDIIPGYYINKDHWNSIYLDKDVPEKVVKEMIDMSYQLIFSSLPKKIQKEFQHYEY